MTPARLTARLLAAALLLGPAAARAPGTYPGQAEPIHSFAAWNFVAANRALPEAAAHRATQAARSASDPAREISPAAAATRPQNAAANRILPFHPGAARLYVELGVRLP